MNQEAEYILIGSILKENSIFEELTIGPDQFSDISNQNIFRAMQAIKKKGFPIDAASLKDELGETGFLFIGGKDRLEQLKDTVPSVHGFKSYEQMVINQWKLSAARNVLNESLTELTLEKIQETSKQLADIDEAGTQEEFDLSDQLRNMYNLATVPQPQGRSGIPSGFLDIDNKTDGFQGNDLIIVGARPSIGKTAFLLNLAVNASTKGNAIPIIFSLEMSAESLIKRTMSCLTEINGMKLKNLYQYTTDDEKTRWINSIGVMEQINPRIFDKPRQKVSEMRAKVRKIKHENPDKKIIVFIDYMTLIKPAVDYKGNMHAAITEISADLKALAKEYKCPVVCLAQLSREVEKRADKRPTMADLRESGSIEQDADIVMMLYRDEYYNETTQENKDVLEVGIAKNRDGEVGPVKLLYKKEINKIENFYHYHTQKASK